MVNTASKCWIKLYYRNERNGINQTLSTKQCSESSEDTLGINIVKMVIITKQTPSSPWRKETMKDSGNYETMTACESLAQDTSHLAVSVLNESQF